MRGEERVMVFIDGSNLYQSLKKETGDGRLDFSAFVELLLSGRRLIRTYYYNTALNQNDQPQEYKEQQKFFAQLRKIPYFTVKLGYLAGRLGSFVEKGVDVRIAADMVKYAYEDCFDTGILVSGDGDFAYVVEVVKESGRHVEVVCCKTGSANELRQAADKTTILNPEILAPCRRTLNKQEVG